MKVKDLLGLLVDKIQLYYESCKLPWQFCKIGNECYIFELSKELLELEVKSIFVRKNGNLAIGVMRK